MQVNDKIYGVIAVTIVFAMTYLFVSLFLKSF